MAHYQSHSFLTDWNIWNQNIRTAKVIIPILMGDTGGKSKATLHSFLGFYHIQRVLGYWLYNEKKNFNRDQKNL